MLYYIENVIDVSALCEDKQMQRDMEIYAKIRNKVLDECYSIKGYSELPCAEKAKIYDSIRAKYIDENGNIIDYSICE
jgi:hypothetical protein